MSRPETCENDSLSKCSRFVGNMVKLIGDELATDKSDSLMFTKSSRLLSIFVLSSDNTVNGRSACSAMITIDLAVNNDMSKMQLVKLFSILSSSVCAVRVDVLQTAYDILCERINIIPDLSESKVTGTRSEIDAIIERGNISYGRPLFLALLMLGHDDEYCKRVSNNFSALLSIANFICRITDKRDVIRYFVSIVDDLQRDMRLTNMFNPVSRMMIEQIVDNVHNKLKK